MYTVTGEVINMSQEMEEMRKKEVLFLHIHRKYLFNESKNHTQRLK